MKFFLRIALILVVAAAVIGVAVALTQIPAVQTLLAQAGSTGHSMPAQGAVTTAQFTLSASTVQRSGAQMPARVEGGQGFSLASITEVVKNLVIVTVITLLVAVPSWFMQRQRRATAPKPARA
jgi:hypothetical protein